MSKLTIKTLVLVVGLCLLAFGTVLWMTIGHRSKGGTNILVQGSPIHGANGLFFDAQDKLHIGSVFGREIVVMDPGSGAILERLGPEAGVETPDDVTFGPDGSLYWTAILTGEVGRRAPDGTVTRQFVAPNVNPITLSGDGRLFVASCFASPNGLWELDPISLEVLRQVSSTIGEETNCALNGMDFGSDGFLYGPRWFLGDIVKVDVDTGKYETVATGFDTPAAVKFDSQGQLHVLDAPRGEVLRVVVEDGKKALVAQLKPGLDNLAFDSRDRLYVSNAWDGSIHHVLSGGEALVVSGGGMICPSGVAIVTGPGGSNRLVVADYYLLRVFDSATGEPTNILAQELGAAGMAQPTALAQDGRKLILTSAITGVVQVWDCIDWKMEETFGPFSVPLHAVRFQGKIAVTQSFSGKVSWADDNTAPIAEGLKLPVGLAGTDDDLWVSDYGTSTIYQIVKEGKIIDKAAVTAGLTGPEGIAIDRDGNLLVVESGAACLSRVDLATGEKTVLATDLELGAPGPPKMPSWLFNGVAVAPDGSVFVTGDRANVVYQFRR
jgi:sugar lactone lactonase YvrE